MNESKPSPKHLPRRLIAEGIAAVLGAVAAPCVEQSRSSTDYLLYVNGELYARLLASGMCMDNIVESSPLAAPSHETGCA